MRRKEEGPKKIGDVHKDAQREASNQARGGGPLVRGGGGRDERGPPPQRSGDRGGGFSGAGPGGRDDRGAPGGRGAGDRGGGDGRNDARNGDRGGRGDGGRGGRDGRDGSGRAPVADPPPRAMRGTESGGRLAPGGGRGDGRGAGDRLAGGAPAPRGGIPGPKPGDRGETGGAKKQSGLSAEQSESESSDKGMSDETYETQRKRVLDYFFDDKDADEAIRAIHGWGPSFEPRVPSFVANLVVSGFERRQMDWQAAGALFRRLPGSVGGPATPEGLVAGIKLVLDDLEDHKCDLPLADTHLATVLAGAVADGSVDFAAVATACAEAGPEGEVGYLKEEGGALPVLCRILGAISASFGTPRAEQVLLNSKVTLGDFLGNMDKEDGATIESVLAKHGLDGLVGSLTPLLAKLAEPDVTGDQLVTWIADSAKPSARVGTEFVGEVTKWALTRGVPNDVPTGAPVASLEPFFKALLAACKGPEKKDGDKKDLICKLDREVAVLYAAQRFCASRDFPEGLLERIFRDLHAGDVLDETAMKAWRDDASCAIGLETIPGKEKALFQAMELLQEFASDTETETEETA
jgi:hypothetical protein